MAKGPERIGILLVHGVGEQRRFDHLDGSVRDIVDAMRAAAGKEHVTVDVPPGATSNLGAERWSLQASDKPTAILHVGEGPQNRVEIGVHEVWWADLDEPASWRKSFRFWFWGLSMWATAARDQHRPSKLPGLQFMELPKLPRRQLRSSGLRLRLFSVGFVFLMLLLSWRLLRVLADRLRVKLPEVERVLVDYVDDVRLYRQPRGKYRAPLDDIGQPPRVAIRRRMVDGIVNVALAEYDRWYVVAHSLGTVVAFNGLMETGHCLPNYLDRERWLAIRNAGMGGARRPTDQVGAAHPMMPARPPWLADDEVMYRDELFAGLRGLLTYGSPLDKFAAIWPTIVNVNKQDETFHAKMQWINVYDPTDPVSGALDGFDLTAGGKLAPTNYATAASPVLLLSHIRYLTRRGGANPLPACLAKWLALGGDFTTIASTAPWLTRATIWLRRAWAYLQWFVVAAALTLAATWVIGQLLEAMQWLLEKTKWLQWFPGAWEWFQGVLAIVVAAPWWHVSLGLIAFDIAAVLAIGVMHRLIFRPE